MKVARTGLLVVFLVAIPLLLFASAVRIVVNAPLLYHYGFAKYNIPAATGIEIAELDRAARELVQYFNSSDERLHIVLKDGMELYTEKEITHLKDVKELIQFDYRLQIATLAYVVGYIMVALLRKRKGWRLALARIGQGLIYGAGLTLAIMSLLGIALLVAFDRVFLAFHLIGFSNLLWVLDPATDKLIQMFPGGFFFDAALILAGVTLAGAILTGAVGWWLHLYGKRRFSRLLTLLALGHTPNRL